MHYEKSSFIEKGWQVDTLTPKQNKIKYQNKGWKVKTRNNLID